MVWTDGGGKRERAGRREENISQDIFNYPSNMSQPGQQEDEQLQRPEVREEDLAEAKNKLGGGGQVKSKTFEVMEECEKVGKVAPSVFSGVKSGAETAFNTRSGRPIRK